jgi:hypothetical protein
VTCKRHRLVIAAIIQQMNFSSTFETQRRPSRVAESRRIVRARFNEYH